MAGLLALNLVKTEKSFFRSQKIFIIPGILIFLAALAELCGLSVADYNEVFATYLVDFLLINNSHAVFSLAAIFFIPEAAAVVSNRKRYFYTVTVVLLLILFFLTLSYKVDVKARLFVEIILSYFGLWHAIKQTYGLIRLYSMTHLKEFKSKGEVLFEKVLIYSLLFLSVTFNPRTVSRIEGLLNVKLEASLVLQPSLILMAFLIFVLFVINIKDAKNFRTVLIKLLYVFPYVVFPYSCMTVLGFVMLKAVHGVQAYYVYKSIYTESRASAAQKSGFLVTSCLLMTFQAVAYIFMIVESQYWLNILISYFTISISYIHYYHERFLFKIKNQPA